MRQGLAEVVVGPQATTNTQRVPSLPTYLHTYILAGDIDTVLLPEIDERLPGLALPSLETSRREFPTFELPILQSHLDTMLVGALTHGNLFAAEWLNTIEGWSSFWLNDRLGSRRPWVQLPNAREIDTLLQQHPPSDANTFSWRAHSSE